MSSSSRLASDGIWTWYNDPRAIVRNGALYFAFVRGALHALEEFGNGDVVVVKIVLATGARTSFILADEFQVDDHSNPALAFLADGRLIALYGRHSSTEEIRYRISTSAEDVSAWGTEAQLPNVTATGTDRGATYANPWVLPDESDRVYVMFRGANWLPVIVYSDDDGATWSTPRELFQGVTNQRPYAKYVTDGDGKLHFFMTPGHPAELTTGTCHMYHCYYDAADGNFHTTDGTVIRSLASLATTGALTASEVTKVYDATTHNGGGNGNAWPWSIELNPSGDPVVTFSAFEAIDDSDYFYAYWDGSAWVRRRILTGQGSLYGVGDTTEDQYVGGLSVDPADTNRIVLSVESGGTTFEIESWTTADNGQNWTTSAITSGSSVKNFRPAFPRGGSGRVLWVRGRAGAANGGYTDYDTYATEIHANPAVVSPTYRELMTSLSPSSHLTLDDPSGTVADALAGADGTYVNTPTLGVAAAIAEGAAVTFASASSERCDLPDVSAIEGSATYAVFFKTTATSGWMLVEASTTDSDPWGAILIDTSRVKFSVRGNTGTEVADTTAANYNDGSWHLAVMTWDGSTIRGYVDGVLRVSATGTPGARTVNTATVAALRRASVSGFFNGTVDEPAIWAGVVLTASQIEALYEARDVEVDTPTGTVTQTLPAITQAAAGTVGTPGFSGAVAQTLPSLSQAAAGTVAAPIFAGIADQALPAITQAATGAHIAPAFTGTAGQTLPSLTQAATGSVTQPQGAGVIAQTLPALTQAATGTRTVPQITGSATQALPSLTQTATGSTQPPTYTAEVAQTLPALTQSATGTRTVPGNTGTVAQSLPALTQTATGGFDAPVFSAVIAQTLPMLTQALTDRKPVASVTLGVGGGSLALAEGSAPSLSLSTRSTPTLEVT